jgi:hypothetical protein
MMTRLQWYVENVIKQPPKNDVTIYVNNLWWRNLSGVNKTVFLHAFRDPFYPKSSYFPIFHFLTPPHLDTVEAERIWCSPFVPVAAERLVVYRATKQNSGHSFLSKAWPMLGSYDVNARICYVYLLTCKNSHLTSLAITIRKVVRLAKQPCWLEPLHFWHIQVTPISILGRDTDRPEWGFLRYASVLPYKCQYVTEIRSRMLPSTSPIHNSFSAC